MAVVMRNELAAQSVARMAVRGPARGMESIGCQLLSTCLGHLVRHVCLQL
jgi:LDH2 family malate/lactate/ureidoglycolate dehydrogenase|eukprot:COSAG01_NODE_12012_length_1816_cov_13.527082_2_plen_50_part_00